MRYTIALTLIGLALSSACSTGGSSNAPYSDPPPKYASLDNQLGIGAPTTYGNDSFNGTIQAIVATIQSAHSKDHYKKNWIQGKCFIHTGSGDSIGAPCSNLVLILKDANTNTEVSRKPCSSDGSFSFRTDEGQNYFISVNSTRLSEGAKDQGPFQAGQEVMLSLSVK